MSCSGLSIDLDKKLLLLIAFDWCCLLGSPRYGLFDGASFRNLDQCIFDRCDHPRSFCFSSSSFV